MKKIICLLLAVTCVFALFSCGSGEGTDIKSIVEGSKPTKITTMVYFTGEESLEGKFINTIDGNKSVFEFDFQRLAEISEMEDGYIKEISGKVYYKDGKVSLNEGDSWESSAVSSVANYDLKLDERNFATYELSEDKNSFEATIDARSAKTILGVEIYAVGTVTVKVVTNGAYLNRITISYKTADADVVIDTSYTYSPITLDF
jgi:hypothetical protein